MESYAGRARGPHACMGAPGALPRVNLRTQYVSVWYGCAPMPRWFSPAPSLNGPASPGRADAQSKTAVMKWRTSVRTPIAITSEGYNTVHTAGGVETTNH